MSSAVRDPGHDGVSVLASGGLDSAVLTAEFLSEGRVVQPLYVRFGLAWEETEETHLRRFLDTLPSSTLRPLEILDLVRAPRLPDHRPRHAEGESLRGQQPRVLRRRRSPGAYRRGSSTRDRDAVLRARQGARPRTRPASPASAHVLVHQPDRGRP